MKTSVFFAKEGEKGLNRTSSAHLCNIANNVKAKYEDILNEVSFVNSYVSCVSGNLKDIQSAKGYSEDRLQSFPEILDKISFLNGFIAWYREALTVIEYFEREVRNKNYEVWLNEMEYYPEDPKIEDKIELTSREDIIAKMNIKERQQYLELEAKAAVYGKFIHKDSPFMNAKKAVHKAESKPITVDGRGQDAVVYQYQPSINITVVDNMFDKLQAEYRSIEQSLNHMKSVINSELQQYNRSENEHNQKVAQENAAWQDKLRSIRKEHLSEFQMWQNDLLNQYANTKFAIPQKFEKLIEELNNLSK